MALTIARRYTESTMFAYSTEDAKSNMLALEHKVRNVLSGFCLERKCENVLSPDFKPNNEDENAEETSSETDQPPGFGWTNGVVIEFIATFGDELMGDTANDEEEDEGKRALQELYDSSKLFKEAIELNTEMDPMGEKSKLIKRYEITSRNTSAGL